MIATRPSVPDFSGVDYADAVHAAEALASALRERAASVGATLDILSAPGKGTAVRCVLRTRPD